ncbi:MAG: response regulator transcription factor [Chloroflexi bacterium]|nr:response regulator transcription factor [Chloroflexota bacterium]
MATKNTKSSSANVQKINIILIVEDDKHTSRLNRSILEGEGYSVACAGSGEEALNMLTATTPSLVLLDVMLPVMDGFTTFEKIREKSQVPIIFVSTEDRDEDMVRGLEMGADDYIAKPFSTTELAARVKAVLRRNSPRRSMSVAARPLPSEPDMSFLDGPEETDGSPNEPKPVSKAGLFGPSGDLSGSTNGVTQSSSVPAAGNENYEGAVKLVVETAGNIKNLVKFVGSLRENSQFHLLRVVSNSRRDGMDVWLRLRVPTPLRTTLLAGGGVSSVEAVEQSEYDPESGTEMPVLKVSLD